MDVALFIDFSRTDSMVHLRIIQRAGTPFTPTNPVLPILGVIHLIQVKFENRDFLCSDLELYPRVRRTPHTLSACGPDGLFIGRRKNDAGPLGWLRNPNYPISDLVINVNVTYGPLCDFMFFSWFC